MSALAESGEDSKGNRVVCEPCGDGCASPKHPVFRVPCGYPLLVFDSALVLGKPRYLGPPADQRASSGLGAGGWTAIWVVKPVRREAWGCHWKAQWMYCVRK